MNWSDEHYVKLYTRETPNWSLLPWQSRALLPLVLKKSDRAGLIDLGKDHVRALAAFLMVPMDFCESGLSGLLDSGTCELRDGVLITPKFIEAQEARKTKIASAQEGRDRRRDEARADKRLNLLEQPVAARSTSSPSSPAQPSPAQPEKISRDLHPLQALWNAVVVADCPRWQTTEGARLKHADARLKERPDLEWWRALFERINASDFLAGRRNEFRCAPDWILKPANLTKVFEGNYDNGPPRRPQGAVDPDDGIMQHRFAPATPSTPPDPEMPF